MVSLEYFGLAVLTALDIVVAPHRGYIRIVSDMTQDNESDPDTLDLCTDKFVRLSRAPPDAPRPRDDGVSRGRGGDGDGAAHSSRWKDMVAA